MTDAGTATAPSPSTHEWRRTSFDLRVTLVWAYDTTAILPDYDDSKSALLPAGQLLLFSAMADAPGHYLCDLDDPSFVERAALPKGRVQRFRPFCFATRLQAVLTADDYHIHTTPAARPARWHRWTGRLKP
jgi:hypothetical protein